MKNRIITTLLATVTIGICMLASLAAVKYFSTENYINQNLYAQTGIITEINRYSDFVTVTVANGNQFSFYGASDYEEGDFCSMVMDSCGTEIVFDDVIVDTKYDGYLQLFEDIENSI